MFGKKPGNMHVIDRASRVVIGVGLAVLPLFGQFWIFDVAVIALAIIVLGVALIVTGLIGICPIYKAAGISTAKRDH